MYFSFLTEIYRKVNISYIELPFFIESPESKASKLESTSLQHAFLILSSSSVRSDMLYVIFSSLHVTFNCKVYCKNNEKFPNHVRGNYISKTHDTRSYPST